LKQQELLIENQRKQQERLTAELEHEQKRELCLSKNLSKLQRETVKNEKISASLLQKRKENIDAINSVQSEIRRLNHEAKEYQDEIFRFQRRMFELEKQFAERKLQVELEIQKIYR